MVVSRVPSRSSGAFVGFVLLAALESCGRTTLDFVWSGESHGNEAGGSGVEAGGRPSAPHGEGGRGAEGGNGARGGGADASFGGYANDGNDGGSDVGGSDGDEEPPVVDPGGPIPNCAFDVTPEIDKRDDRWLGFLGRPSGTEDLAVYLVELSGNGPRHLTYLADVDGEPSPGGFSGDGRYYAMVEYDAYSPVATHVYAVTSNEPPLEIDLPDDLNGVIWSPTGSRFFSGAGQGKLVIADAADPAGSRTDISLPGSLTLARWWPDGKYLALAVGAAAFLIDVSNPAQLVPLAGVNASFVWSSDPRFLAHRNASGLHVLDTSDWSTRSWSAEGHQVQDHKWISPSTLVWRGVGNETFFVDVSSSPLESLPLADQAYFGAPSPSGKCFAYIGVCDATQREGVCITMLPPTVEHPSVMVGGPQNEVLTWAASSDHLLFYEGWIGNGQAKLWSVRADGGPYDAIEIASDFEAVSQVAGYNPGPAEWVGYFPDYAETDEPDRLWQQSSGKTHGFDLEGLLPVSSLWSPDGAYYVVSARTRTYPPSKGPLLVQRVNGSELGERWRLDGMVASWNARRPTDFSWQP
jgi:hypothetical protein